MRWMKQMQPINRNQQANNNNKNKTNKTKMKSDDYYYKI